jgi:GTPase SAR1 family protein
VVAYDEGFSIAKKNGLFFMECSAKSGVNIEAVFTQISEMILTKIEKG